METINNELEGYNHTGKKSEVRTQRLFEKHYLSELKKMTALSPVGRESLIQNILTTLEGNGVSDAEVMAKCNHVLTNVALPNLVDSTFQYLKLNGNVRSFLAEKAIIIGLNYLLQEIKQPEQYTEYHYIRNANAFSVSESNTKLTENDKDAIQKNKTNKVREAVRTQFFQKYNALYSTFKKLVLHEDILLEYFEENPKKFGKGKIRYHEYLKLNELYEQHIYKSDYGSLLKPPQPLAQPDFEQILQSLKNGQGLNVPTELKELVIMSILS